MNYLLTGQESERLNFAVFDRRFFDAWLDFYSEPIGAAFLGLTEDSEPRQLCEKIFERMQQRKINNLGGMNALIEKDSGGFVGISGLLVQEVDGKKELEIAYSLLPDYRNRGFATEAALKCMDFAFSNNLSTSLISIIDVENTNSEKVAQRIGMKLHKQTLYNGIKVNIYRVYI